MPLQFIAEAFSDERSPVSLTPRITGVARELLDNIGREETDIVHCYTIPLPVKVIARLLGIPGEDYETFKRWSDAFLSLVVMDHTARMQTIQEMVAYSGKMASARRALGAEDLITALVEAEIEEKKLEEWEILGFCMLLLIAGNETTTNLIATYSTSWRSGPHGGSNCERIAVWWRRSLTRPYAMRVRYNGCLAWRCGTRKSRA